MNNEIINTISKELGCTVVDQWQVSGGCIAQCNLLSLSDGSQVFCKSGTKADSFIKEANGLNEIAKANVIRVPKVLFADKSCLLLENVEQGSKLDVFFEDFGQQLARLHQYKGEFFGFFEDNYIGATIQINAGEEHRENWTNFYFHNRLMYQYKLAVRNGYDDGTLQQLFAKLENKISDIVLNDEEPSLLHGDLWGGNFLCNENGNPVLIDPAVYYGHREADLAMTSLFGGFSSAFYAAYIDTYPLSEGWEYREGIYQLYHVMNHLNMFGSSYYSQVLTILKQYV